MKAIVFISLILVVTVSAAMAAETHMTIQTNTTIKIDPATGDIKGDAQTQIKGIKIEPDPAASPAADTSSTGTGTTPTKGAASADSGAATTAATGASASNTTPTSTTAAGGPSSTAPCPTCPLTQAPAGQSN